MTLFDNELIPRTTNGKYYVGIDNGSSGTIAIIKPDGSVCMKKIPAKSEQSYTKTKKNITRVDFNKLCELLAREIPEGASVYVAIERPVVNPGRFNATVSGLRALEAVLIVIDDVMKYPFGYIDSKEWQKSLLPSGIKGTPELKKASLDIGNRLFPAYRDFKHPDRDGLLIAEYIRRKGL